MEFSVIRLRLVLPLILSLASPPAWAQPSPPPAVRQPVSSPRQPTAAEIRQFVSNFEAGVTKGCLQNPPKDVKSPSRYCSCYARSLVSQYQPGELAAMNRLAASSQQVANIIVLMTAPYARSCRAAIAQPPSQAR